jgi:hypothetical protein
VSSYSIIRCIFSNAAGNTATVTLTVTLTSTLPFTDDPLVAQGTLSPGGAHHGAPRGHQ